MNAKKAIPSNIRIKEEQYIQIKEIQLQMILRDKEPSYSLADAIDEILIVYNEYKDEHDRLLAQKAEDRIKEERTFIKRIKKGQRNKK